MKKFGTLLVVVGIGAVAYLLYRRARERPVFRTGVIPSKLNVDYSAEKKRMMQETSDPKVREMIEKIYGMNP